MLSLKQIPNALTVFRFLLAIVFPMSPPAYHTAIILTALATEFLDGYLARHFNWTTEGGKVLDPIADKSFFLSVCLTWIWLGRISWTDLALSGTREIGILATALYIALRGRLGRTKAIQARPLSKVTTVLQYGIFFSVCVWDKPRFGLVALTAVTGGLAALEYMVLLHREETLGNGTGS